MSELTFNIADYRRAGQGRTRDRGPEMEPRTGFVVLSASEPRRYERLDARPAVVDIRSICEGRGASPRSGKILRFRNPASHRLYTMPAHTSVMSTDDDPGPMVA